MELIGYLMLVLCNVFTLYRLFNLENEVSTFLERANMHMAGLLVLDETPEAQPGIGM